MTKSNHIYFCCALDEDSIYHDPKQALKNYFENFNEQNYDEAFAHSHFLGFCFFKSEVLPAVSINVKDNANSDPEDAFPFSWGPIEGTKITRPTPEAFLIEMPSGLMYYCPLDNDDSVLFNSEALEELPSLKNSPYEFSAQPIYGRGREVWAVIGTHWPAEEDPDRSHVIHYQKVCEDDGTPNLVLAGDRTDGKN